VVPKRGKSGVVTDEARSRTSRQDPLLRVVRARLSRERDLPPHLRRLERMERTARMWVNGRELGKKPRFGYLAEGYD
jgi:hypothetical protein